MLHSNLRLRRLFRFICILTLLCMLLPLISACLPGSEPPSDGMVKDAAKAFANALKAAGKSGTEIIEQARVEAKKWGPKAELFVQTVIEELKK